jgi:hypothetical protein
MRRQIPLKRRFLQEPHGVTTQKTPFFIVTAVKTSNLTSTIRIIKSRRMMWAGHVARIGEKKNSYRSLLGKSEGKRPLGRPRLMGVDIIKMDLVETEWGGVDCIGLVQDK